jgi:hypothetical protein
MATRSIFTHNSSIAEQKLISSLVKESIQVVGFDAMYLPRFSKDVDPLLGDANKTVFDKAYLLEMYFENPEDGFGDSVDYISSFGFEVRDSASFVFSVDRFKELKVPNFNEPVVDSEYPDLEMPLEGDLIYLPLTKSILEVNFVEDWVPFFELGANYVFKTMCRLMVFDNQQFGSDTSGEITLYGNDRVEILDADQTEDQKNSLIMIESIDETWNKSIIDDQGTTDTSDDVIDAITSDNTFDQSDIFQDEPDLLDMTEDNPFGEF